MEDDDDLTADAEALLGFNGSGGGRPARPTVTPTPVVSNTNSSDAVDTPTSSLGKRKSAVWDDFEPIEEEVNAGYGLARPANSAVHDGPARHENRPIVPCLVGTARRARVPFRPVTVPDRAGPARCPTLLRSPVARPRAAPPPQPLSLQPRPSCHAAHGADPPPSASPCISPSRLPIPPLPAPPPLAPYRYYVGKSEVSFVPKVTSSYLCKPNSESWKFDWKIEVCFHRNASIDLCQCEAAECQGLQDGIWTAVNCSSANKYVDVKLSNKKPAWFTLSIQEAVQVMKAAAGRGNSCVE